MGFFASPHLPTFLPPLLFAAVEAFTESLRIHLQRLIVYAQGTDPELQRQVAEKLGVW